MLKYKQGDFLVTIYLFQFLFYLIFFIFNLYSLLDKKLFMFSQGRKIDEYMKNNDLININSSNVKHKLNLNYFISTFLKSPYKYKQLSFILLVSLTIMAFKIALTYKFIQSNIFIISIYRKNIDIASILSNYYILFKIIYYILFVYFDISITCFISKIFYNNKRDDKKDINSNSIINLGKKDNNYIGINIDGCYQNILITGSIGSGKTSAAINTLLYELLKKDIYGLILDVKGNYIDNVRKIAKLCNKENNIIEISLKSKFSYNPLDSPNVSSIELANILRNILEIISENKTSDGFWLDKSEGYIRDLITIMRFYMDNINFKEMHNLIVSQEYLNNIIDKIKKELLKKSRSDEQTYEVTASINNITNEYMKLDLRTLSIIKAEMTRITDAFSSDYLISKKFCTKSDKLDFFSDNIYVLSIDIANNKKIAKIISTYLKFEFQRQVLSNKNFSKSVFFICDEYQEFCNSPDSHFFSLSRQYKCINILSVQSYSSLISSLKDEMTANVIIQNLVNKIWFRNDDNYTVKQIINQLGKCEKARETLSFGESGQDSRYSILFKKFVNRKSGLSKNHSITKNIENLINEEYITLKLKTFHAICLLSNGNSIQLYQDVKINKLDI